MSQTTFLPIESNDRASGTSSSFRWVLPSSVRNPRRVTLLNAEIPLTHYNVRSTNNTFVFSRSSVSYTATVTEGSYNLTTLLTALGAAMTAADTATTFSFSTSSTTNKVTLTSSSSISIVTETILSKALGFTSSQSGTTIVAANAYVLGDMVFFISLGNLPTNMRANVSAHFRIPLTQDRGYIQFYEATAVNQQFVECDNSAVLSSLDVSLVDIHGSAVSLNGSEWSMLLKIDYED